MIHYEFKDFGALNALRIILDHEGIDATYGVGPGGMTLSVVNHEEAAVQKAVGEWMDALRLIYAEVNK